MEDSAVNITIEPSPSIPYLKIITMTGNFDTVTSQQVDEKIMPIIEQEKSNLIFDLSNINYLSSVGILRLIKYLTSMTDQKRLIKFVKPTTYIYSTFVAAGIASRFDMYDSLEAAIGSF
jgi:anti-anti-sigma factor